MSLETKEYQDFSWRLGFFKLIHSNVHQSHNWMYDTYHHRSDPFERWF